MKDGSSAVKERFLFIDMARFYAMVLVFYGHFIEEIMLLKNPTAAVQYKFIYSFHMILFIVLAGYVAKEEDSTLKIGAFMKSRFFSRLLPFIFFTLLMMIPPLFLNGKFFGLALPSVAGYSNGLLNTVFGMSSFCIPSWFLLLIIGVELVHYCMFRFLKDANIKILIAAVLFYVVGYFLNLKLDLFNPLKGRIVGWNYFFIHEAITLYAFYLTGILLRRKVGTADKIPTIALAAGAVATFLIVLFTYALNKGPFNFHVYNYVVILFSSHGNLFLFPLTAMAGCAFILCLSKITPGQKILVWLGQNTLILMCLNGIFYHYINPGLAKRVLDLTGSAIGVTTSAIIVTLISLLLCMPIVFVLNKFIPQLVGKPKVSGPLLGNII